jgi:(p)ppGpp synthase/HD superfamily hydrolase
MQSKELSEATVLTDRFDRALLYATHVHGGQVRKGTSTPYVAHLLAVAATVLEYGGDEDLAIAALLHDSVEDQGGKARLTDVRNRFGERVARVVRSLLRQSRRDSERRTKGAGHTASSTRMRCSKYGSTCTI